LFNLSTLVRTNPITLEDGGFYLPVYNEFTATYPELLQFDNHGDFIKQLRMSDSGYLLQPSIVAISENRAIVFLRNKARTNDILYKQDTFDGGLSWNKPQPTNFKNHDSSIVVIRLNNGKLLMVHDVYGRDQLALAVSKDGVRWQDIKYLENDKGFEFSYPAILEHNGVIDILYTWKRRDIKHVRFNMAWLMEQAR
jgi:predicted neuraminidase